MTLAEPRKLKKSALADSRTLARLAAVQALYQMEHSGTGVNAVIEEFERHRLGGELDGATVRQADRPFFVDIVLGVVDMQGQIDLLIEKNLSSGWTLSRLDATARAILRGGLYELLRRTDVPVKVVLDEYIELTIAFFEEDAAEPRFVNGVLDAIAKTARADEL